MNACFLFTDYLLPCSIMSHRVKVVCNAHVEDDDPGKAYDLALGKNRKALIARLRAPYSSTPFLQENPEKQNIQAEKPERKKSRKRKIPSLHHSITPSLHPSTPSRR